MGRKGIGEYLIVICYLFETGITYQYNWMVLIFTQDQFKASEIFGKNYQTALTDPNAQQQHQANLPATPPPTSPSTARLEFQGIWLKLW